jgi:hypothetical protein
MIGIKLFDIKRCFFALLFDCCWRDVLNRSRYNFFFGPSGAKLSSAGRTPVISPQDDGGFFGRG